MKSLNNLTLFAPVHCSGEGGISAPCHVFAYIHANMHTSALKKNLTYLSYEFGKGQYTYLVSLKKKKFVVNAKIS